MLQYYLLLAVCVSLLHHLDLAQKGLVVLIGLEGWTACEEEERMSEGIMRAIAGSVREAENGNE